MPNSSGSLPTIATDNTESLDDRLSFRTVHDIRWNKLSVADAPLARKLLARADELRKERADPGDAHIQAYLAGRAERLRPRATKTSPFWADDF